MLRAKAATAAQSFRTSCRFLRRRAHNRSNTATKVRKMNTDWIMTIVGPPPLMLAIIVRAESFREKSNIEGSQRGQR